jgi:hypothetical protein
MIDLVCVTLKYKSTLSLWAVDLAEIEQYLYSRKRAKVGLTNFAFLQMES